MGGLEKWQSFRNWEILRITQYCYVGGKIIKVTTYNLRNRSFSFTIEMEKKFTKILASPTGNRTPVSCMTDGDTYHYTIEDKLLYASALNTYHTNWINTAIYRWFMNFML